MKIPILFGCFLLIIACSPSQKMLRERNDLQRLVSYMSGSFSSAAQARQDSAFFDVSLHMVPIWTSKNKDQNGYWLYVEQAMTATLDKPYRQRVYRVWKSDEKTFRSEVYLLKNEKSAVGAWKNPALLDHLQEDDLDLKAGCAVILQLQSDGTYAGGTEGTGCESTLRGAAYAVSKVKVTPQSLETWDQGFDKTGKQVWGAVKGGYVFKRAE